MEFPTDLSTYTLWSAYLTVASLCLTIVGFVLKWGIRFRLVGVTGFMGVLTAGIFALGLGLYTRTEVPNAVRYALVYDNGANQAVISVANEVDPSKVEATLYQAADDLYSFGRVDREGNQKLTVRLRTLVHPEPGVTLPLYLGEVKRSLRVRDDDQIQVTIFTDKFAQLPQNTNS
ncbi:conserved hypothetical protein [Gloeothece citriformis PCC 7424]|uniref:DUF2518 family protein n=1 Tax=Gloeothece citriformis (strain PCC 7424) TaxID=65393 RepID=B7K7J7_GLOC7|nr:Ycf51 family protein [Gloeothece citriformis]ACK69765.1 conserved hypothetical protein [Gloeothece citriformis PCC 7424]